VKGKKDDDDEGGGGVGRATLEMFLRIVLVFSGERESLNNASLKE